MAKCPMCEVNTPWQVITDQRKDYIRRIEIPSSKAVYGELCVQDTFGIFSKIEPKEKNLYIVVFSDSNGDDNDEPLFEVEVNEKIKFCPYCGREL